MGVNQLEGTTPFMVFINFPLQLLPLLSPSPLYSFLTTSSWGKYIYKVYHIKFAPPPAGQIPHALTVPINARSNPATRAKLFSLHYLLLCSYCKSLRGPHSVHGSELKQQKTTTDWKDTTDSGLANIKETFCTFDPQATNKNTVFPLHADGR